MSHGMEAAQCREVLMRIAQDEIRLLQQLEVLLQQEHDYITANDIDSLERAGAQRQDCIAQLMKLGDERRDLCRMLGKGSDLAAVSALLAWCDPHGTLAPLMTEHAQRSSACRAQNERNGALVGARMARLNNMLGLLNGGQGAVYGPGGTRDPALPTSGRLVAASA